MKELKINHFAVWVAIVLQFVIGFLWYGPVFGDPWMNAVGLDMDTIMSDPAGAEEWITNIISSVVSIYVLAWFFRRLKVTSWAIGLWYGFLIGFSFVLLSTMTSNMFAKMPYGLAWITAGFTTVGLMVGGVILGAWTRFKE
jgi:hypothetical protein